MNKKITLILFLLLQCSMLMAQDYVYPVSSGTSWSREVFPRVEREQQEVMKHGKPIPGAPCFGQIFKQLSYTFDKANLYNDSIFYDLSHKEWIDMFERRAASFAQFYDENNNAIDQLKTYFSRNHVPDAAYDSLYFYTRSMYHHNASDIFLYEELIDFLIPHYEETHDIEHLVFCYMCAGLCHFQCARMGDREAALRSEIAYHKVINLRDKFSTFKDPLNYYYFIAAYVNLAIMHTQAGNASLQESLNITQNIKKIYDSPEVQTIFAKDSILHEFANWSIDLFSLRGISIYISQGWKGQKMKNQLYDAYKEFKDKISNDFNSLNKLYYAKLPYEDQLIEAFMGHITWDEARNNIRELFVSDEDMLMTKSTTPIQIGYLNNLFETALYVNNKSTASFEDKQRSVKIMLEATLTQLSHYEHGHDPFEKGMILDKMARKEELLQYLNTQERRDLLFRLIVTEQPTTYVHVTMVADLAKVLAEHLIDKKPEFFVGVPRLNSVQDVIQKKDSLVDFIYDAAIFHDLGKISMPTVVNNSTRKITDHEYNILSLHPQKSLPFFAIDQSLNFYQDIALGHHKWYNGKGYPATFDNLTSKYFPIIAITTVCDCLDAATENIGRNYHHPKPFETVLKEFEAESGTRYHPEIVKFIKQDKTLQNEMKKIVSDGRYDHYYKMYTGYMQNGGNNFLNK